MLGQVSLGALIIILILSKHHHSHPLCMAVHPVPFRGEDGLVGGCLLLTVQLLDFSPDVLAGHTRLARHFAHVCTEDGARMWEHKATVFGFYGCLERLQNATVG